MKKGIVRGANTKATRAETEQARRARSEATEAEWDAWDLLRRRQVLGLKFRRQQIIGKLRVDFYCAELRIALELDGSAHDSEAQQLCDEERSKILHAYGVTVLRLRNEQLSLRTLTTLLLPFLPPSPLREKGLGVEDDGSSSTSTPSTQTNS